MRRMQYDYSSRISDIILFLFSGFFFLFTGCMFKQESYFQLSNVFGNHMVLQRNKPINIQGKASPGSKITVYMGEHTIKVKASVDSLWNASIPSMKAGGPYKLQVHARDTTVSFTDIMIGDVWLASGQSNMEWKLSWDVNNHDEEIATADYPDIRFFTVHPNYSATPRQDVDNGNWMVCSPDTAGSFSAVAYFFARHIHREKNVPVGMIVSAIGGSTIKGWIAGEPAQQNHTEVDTSVIFSEYDDESWDVIQLPAYIENMGFPDYDGYSWYRKTVFVNNPGKGLTVHLGKIDDADVVWFNGHRIGATDSYGKLRVYNVDPKLVRKNNTLVVRVLDKSGLGGLWGPEQEMYVSDADGLKLMNLADNWKYSISIKPQFPTDELIPAQPGVMYNAMIHPLTKIPVKGILWYQGEADASIAQLYSDKLKELIESWRKGWNNPSLPFIFVQLPNFMEKSDSLIQKSSKWALLREAQLQSLQINHTGMAVIIDSGEAGDVHPKNKQIVGQRLALAARNVAYDEHIRSCGPIYQSYSIKGDSLKLSFDHAQNGLLVKGDALEGFVYEDLDGNLFKPKSWIEGNKVILLIDKDINLKMLYYAWADNPNCNLYNREGLPASPFRIKF